MEFIINTRKWINGNSPSNRGYTYLLNDKGYMCCLGFCSLQSGLKKEDILKIGSPGGTSISIKHFSYKKNGIIKNTIFSKKAIKINDDLTTSVKEKKKLLGELFKKHGHTITFK